jgi:dihydrofolate synthase / folylpolyglutamate synthase
VEGEDFNPLYYQTIDEIYHSQWVAAQLARLDALREFIGKLWPQGHPTKLIQVAGTSGKGSVCKFLEAGLSLVGRAGTLTGPHLFDYRERFSIDGALVSRADIMEAWENRIKPLCIELARQRGAYVPRSSDIYTLMALTLFEKHAVEWGVVETGIGGRYDNVTALDVSATVLTNVGRDHEAILGSELWQRVLDKAGISRPSTPMFTSERNELALRIISEVCRRISAPLCLINHEDVGLLKEAMQPYSATASTALLGAEHQLLNATLSAVVIHHFYPNIELEALAKRFSTLEYGGRFTRFEENIYADIAHNPDKIEALVERLKELGFAGRVIFVVGLSAGRMAQDTLAPLLAISDRFVVTSASFKGVPPYEVAGQLKGMLGKGSSVVVVEDPRKALVCARNMLGKDDIVVLTGSTYMIEQSLNPDPYMRHLNATYGWRTRRYEQPGLPSVPGFPPVEDAGESSDAAAYHSSFE